MASNSSNNDNIAPAKLALSALPLPTEERLITKQLTPDPRIPDVKTFREIQQNQPSIQRRGRLLSSEAHFSYVSPFVLSFPYDISPPSKDGKEEENEVDMTSFIENWLAEREAVHQVPAASSGIGLGLHYPRHRNATGPNRRYLIGLAETTLRDCLPHLDVGNAFELLGTPALAKPSEDSEEKEEEEEEGNNNPDIDSSPSTSNMSNDPMVNRRQELVDVLSGYAVLMSSPRRCDDVSESGSTNTTPSSEEVEFGPFACRYSGHQFGDWAGQLGDGRAISIHVAQHPTIPNSSYELQLKGAGRTPFSRSADGLAVLRSSIREYLCSEALHALEIPSTRALSLVYLPDVTVAREKIETACVLTRVAESFIRIGSFEALNPPSQMYFFGGGQQAANYEALRIMGEWVSTHVLKIRGEGSDEAWGEKLVMEVAQRNARMVAGWQAYGFMHGVINTDNVSIMGLTIDYGPYAFMDKFDRHHICNHSDSSGRYSYKLQPSMIIFAMRALLKSLAPLIGKEKEMQVTSVKSGWADGASKESIEQWKEQGLTLSDELDRVIQETCSVEYGKLMRKRLGLTREEKTDETNFFRPFLDMLEEHELDFHISFRMLCFFSPEMMTNEASKNEFIGRILDTCASPNRVDRPRAMQDWTQWLARYSSRIESEGIPADERRQRMMKANPRFVLRQWVLQETIERVEKNTMVGKRFLGKVMQMACRPFEPWGKEGEDDAELLEDEEAREERRLCERGEKTMLGFQCSCSS